MSTTYFHVADRSYKPGEDLFCWDELERLGCAPEWKWEEADIGFDGDVVCLFESLDEAREFQAAHSPDGIILRVELPEPAPVRVEEGYPAVYGRVPATYIRPA